MRVHETVVAGQTRLYVECLPHLLSMYRSPLLPLLVGVCFYTRALDQALDSPAATMELTKCVKGPTEAAAMG